MQLAAQTVAPPGWAVRRPSPCCRRSLRCDWRQPLDASPNGDGDALAGRRCRRGRRFALACRTRTAILGRPAWRPLPEGLRKVASRWDDAFDPLRKKLHGGTRCGRPATLGQEPQGARRWQLYTMRRADCCSSYPRLTRTGELRNPPTRRTSRIAVNEPRYPRNPFHPRMHIGGRREFVKRSHQPKCHDRPAAPSQPLTGGSAPEKELTWSGQSTMLVTMKNRQRRLGVFLCVIILISLNDFCVGAKADLTEIVDTSDRAEKLKAEGKYIEATRLAERALEMAQAQLDEKTVAFPVFLHRLAGLYREDGRYEEAAELYTRAIKLRGEVDRKRLPNTINDFALLNWDEAKYAEAEQLFMQAKTLYTEQSGPTSEDVATCDTNLGLLYRDMARYDAAEKLMQEGRVIREAQNTGTRDLDIANSLHNIASLDRDQGRFSEAEPLARRGLEIRRAKLGTEHPELAKSMNVLAEILRATGRYDEAIQLLNSAVAIRKRAFGDDHPAVATSLNSLGAVYESQGRLSDAETSYKAALTIREHRLKPLFPGHPDLATSQANLGALYKAQHRYEQAEPLLRSALEIREKTLGKEHPDYLKSLYELGELMKLRGKSGEADEYFDRVLSIRKTAVHQVNIFFATDRKVDAAAKSLAFGSERSNALTFGTANIWVPTELSRAQTPLAASRPLERMSRISQDETTEVARLVIRSKLHVPDTEITDWATAKLGDAQRFRGQALVFVHGFNV